MDTMNTDITPSALPFGFWLRAVDRLLAREFRTAFDAEGLTRRDWRMLSALSDGELSPELSARLSRRGGHKLRRLVERGWIAETDGTWTLTDDGRAAHERLAAVVGGIRARVAAAVPEADFATMLASLEAIARELGWEEGMRMPRARRHGFGHRRHGVRGFAHGHGHGHGRGGQHHHGCAHSHADGHRHDGRRRFERAYERGFEAGFSRGAERADA